MEEVVKVMTKRMLSWDAGGDTDVGDAGNDTSFSNYNIRDNIRQAGKKLRKQCV